MITIRARNPHEALPIVMDMMQRVGVKSDSRNGPVLVCPEPVSIHYEKPEERVVFWAQRDANPFFHLLESVWMLAGRRDVKFVADIVSNMKSFSDDGKTFHGAYGYRWREHHDIDQIKQVVWALFKNPDCRRQVIGIYDPQVDLNTDTKDVPCNLSVVFQCSPRDVNSDSKRRLNMTVFNRSNDAVWGALGANCVHFSILQEVIATACGFDVGWYEQVTTNLHVYRNELGDRVLALADKAPDPYLRTQKNESGYRLTLNTFPIDSHDIDKFLRECSEFCARPDFCSIDSRWLRNVVRPMLFANQAWKKKSDPDRYGTAVEILMSACEDCDWRAAALRWLHRRRAKHDV